MHKMLNIEITKIDGTFWSQTGTDQSLLKLLLLFLRRQTNVSFLTEINVRFMKRKIILGHYIFWDSRSDTFCGFKSFWSNLFRDSFVERKLWFILPFRQRQRICFTKRNVLTYFPIISRCWIENVIVSISCGHVVFPRNLFIVVL